MIKQQIPKRPYLRWNTSDKRELITTAEVAVILNMNPKTVIRRARAGEIPYRFGGNGCKYLFSKTDIKKLVGAEG